MTAAPPYPWLESAWQRVVAAHAAGRLPHAILVSGPLGVGKSALADRIAALALGAPDGPQTDGAGRYAHADLVRIGPDEGKATIGIDQVRVLAGHFALTSHALGTKAAIVEPADAMTHQAANSLLKTLEEPPGASLILLVTARRAALPATVVSRCQQLPVVAPQRGMGLAWLSDAVEPAQAGRLLDLAGGAPLRAAQLANVGFLDTDHKLGDDLVAMIGGRSDAADVAAAWVKTDPALALEWLHRQVTGLIRALQLGETASHVRPELLAHLKKAGAGFSLRDLHRYRDALRDTADRIDGGLNKTLALEALLAAWSCGLNTTSELNGYAP